MGDNSNLTITEKWEWCKEQKIQYKYYFSGHPQANKQDHTRILKKTLPQKKGDLLDELPGPGKLWS